MMNFPVKSPVVWAAAIFPFFVFLACYVRLYNSGGHGLFSGRLFCTGMLYLSRNLEKSFLSMRKWPPGSLKAGSCLALIHRSTVVLLTPQRLAIKPTDIYSGAHSSYAFGNLTSRLRYWTANIIIN
jgi:hypothetical protein